MKSSKLLVLCILITYTLTGWGWGRLGHRLTAAIANEHLTEDAKKAVDLILNHRSMKDVSDWADRIRPTRRYITWHYATLPQYKNIDQIPELDGQLYSAIKYCLNVLNPKIHSTLPEQEIALKLLIHLVGDAHQPLHVGNGQDKGGNLCRVGWYKRQSPVNFHKIWDVFLVKSTLGEHPLLVENSVHIKPETLAQWQHTPIKQWLIESRQQHTFIYPKTIHQTPYCSRHPKLLSLENLPHLGQSYTRKMDPIIRKRLWQGGIRLAYLLNKLFDHNALIMLQHTL